MSKFPVHVLDPLQYKAILFLLRFFCAWLVVEAILLKVTGVSEASLPLMSWTKEIWWLLFSREFVTETVLGGVLFVNVSVAVLGFFLYGVHSIALFFLHGAWAWYDYPFGLSLPSLRRTWFS